MSKIFKRKSFKLKRALVAFFSLALVILPAIFLGMKPIEASAAHAIYTSVTGYKTYDAFAATFASTTNATYTEANDDELLEMIPHVEALYRAKYGDDAVLYGAGASDSAFETEMAKIRSSFARRVMKHMTYAEFKATFNSTTESNYTDANNTYNDRFYAHMIAHAQYLFNAAYPDGNAAEYALLEAELDKILVHYQKDMLSGEFNGDINSPVTYYIGSSSQYKGVARGGYTIKSGHLILECESDSFVFHGSITINSGAKLTVRYKKDSAAYKSADTNNALVRGVVGEEKPLFLTAEPNASGYQYIPVGAKYGILEQFSGAFFRVNGGTLEIHGGYASGDSYVDKSTYLNISGLGEFTHEELSDKENGGYSFPANNVGVVQSCAPLIQVMSNSVVNITNVSLRNNVNEYDANDAALYSSAYDYRTEYGTLAQWGNTGFSYDSTASMGGAMIVSGSGKPQVTMTGSEISGCYSLLSGGAMYLPNSNTGNVTMTGCTVKNCFTGCAVTANVANAKYNGNYGGTIRTLGSSALSMQLSGCTFTNNWTRGSTGGIHWACMANENPLTIDGCTFEKNTSYGSAGAILCYTRLRVEDTTIENNKSVVGNGGGIVFATWSSSGTDNSFELKHNANLEIGDGVIIKGNTASSNGGGIYLSATIIETGTNVGAVHKEYPYRIDENGQEQPYEMSLYIHSGALIESNTAVKGSGGGVYMHKYSNAATYVVKVYMQGGNVKNNTAGAGGGGFYLTGSDVSFTMSGGTIYENLAQTGSGGGVFVENGGNFVMTEGTISKNRTEGDGKYGGGVAVSGSNFEMSGGQISANASTLYYGGGVAVFGGKFTMTDGTIGGDTADEGNTSYSLGGGVSVWGSKSEFSMTGGVIKYNKSINNGGGGVYLSGGDFRMWAGEGGTGTGGEISYNIAGRLYGGGVEVLNGKFTMECGLISHNTAVTNGGGVYVYDNNSTDAKTANFEMSGGNISYNEVTGTGSENGGGGVYIRSGSFTMSDGTITENTAALHGGGVYVLYGDFTMSGGTISDNTSGDKGGGVCVQASASKPATFTMSADAEISGNDSSTSGGGVRLYYGSFIMNGGLITENYTTHATDGCGGGVSVSYGNFVMNSGTVSKNYSSYRGGGIEVRYGSFKMTGGTVGGDTAADGNYMSGNGIGGGVCVWGSGAAFEMTGGKIKYNHTTNNDGGGVYISGGDFRMWKGEDNKGTGGEISYNYARRGGGVYLYQGDYLMQAGLVDSNYAFGNKNGNSLGGGIWIYKGDFTMTGGSFTNNYTTNTNGGHGGAVCVQSGNFTMSGGDLTGNYSAVNGGAVAVLAGIKGASPEYSDDGNTRVHSDVAGSFTMTGGTITGNGKDGSGVIKTQLGGAVYVEGGNFTMSGGDLTENYSTSHGGAVYINERVDITVEYTEAYDSAAKEWNEVKSETKTATLNGNFEMGGGTITLNVAGISGEVNGGAVYIYKGNFSMFGGEISSNSAVNYGGAVYVDQGNFTINVENEKNCQIKENSATNRGGAVYVHFGNFSMTGTTENLIIWKNTVTNGHGGAVYVYGNGTKGNFTMTGGKIYENSGSSNTVSKGGAVFVYKGIFTMNSGEISDNYAGREGGAVFVDGGSSSSAAKFLMVNGTIKDNESSYGGGAVYVWFGNFEMRNGIISGNIAGLSGGAVRVSYGNFEMENGTISGNYTKESGGAVYVDGGTFSMANGTITGNCAEGEGGAVYVKVGFRENKSDGKYNVDIDANDPSKGTHTYLFYSASFTMTGGTISNNGYVVNNDETITVKTTLGGAVYVGGGNFTMTGGTISGNRSTSNGGAVYVGRATVNYTSTVTYTTDGKGNKVETNGDIKTKIYYGNFNLEYDEEKGIECLIDSNHSGEDGGAVYVNLGNFTMTGTVEKAVMSNNTAKGHGGAVYVKGDYSETRGKFTLDGGKITANRGTTVKGNDTGSKGGGVFVYHGTFIMNDGEISLNVAEREGGAVFVDEGNFTMYDGKISENSNNSELSAGAVYVFKSSSNTRNVGNFTMYDGELSDNTSPLGIAGAVCVDGGNFTIYGGTITRNTSKIYAGAVLVVSGGNFYMKSNPDIQDPEDQIDIIISHNSSEGNGGAVYVNGGNFEMERGTISNNSADGYAGAVYVINGEFSMSNDSALSNNSTEKSGGAVYLSGGSFTMNDGTISGNTASKETGGAIYVVNGSFYLMTGTISGNSAKNNGGAVALGNGDFEMYGGLISDNSACWGGAVYVNLGNFTMYDGTISGNYNTAVSGADNELRGGAVLVSGDGDLLGVFSFNGGVIENNGKKDGVVTTKSGGAVFVNKGSFIMGSLKSASDPIMRNNVASIMGGAVYLDQGNFRLNKGTVTANGFINAGTAEVNSGGAIYVAGGDFNMYGGTVSNNLAENNGGAVAISKGDFKMNAGALSGNTASWGGAVHLSGGTFTMSGTEQTTVISGNTAVVEAGAVFVTYNGSDRGKFVMNGGLITLNTNTSTSDQDGAGAVFVFGGDFEMNAGTISYNTCETYAGAIMVEDGKFTMTGGTISNNTSATYGGGIYVDCGSSGSVVMENGFIQNNTAEVGGGVYIEKGNFTIYGGQISSNEAISGGGVYIDDGVFTMSRGDNDTYGTISNNIVRGDESYGGGLYLNNGTVNMNVGYITGNSAGRHGGGAAIGYGTFNMGADAVISSNTSVNWAGGVFLKEGTFNLNGGQIINNITTNDVDKWNGWGAGVYVQNGNFNMTSGIISENVADDYGGGVYIDTGDFIMHGGTISNNIATNKKGGGVYVKTGRFIMTSGLVEGNKALGNSEGYGGGIYVHTGGIAIIGRENCFGKANLPETNELPAHTSCPVFRNNQSAYGGAIALNSASSTFHCGTLTGNSATYKGGAVYVDNANITLYYAIIEGNHAGTYGGGIYVQNSSAAITVQVDSGRIKANTAERGGGIAVMSTANQVATVIIGKEGCDGAPESEHIHPEISGNIATLEGGGFSLESASANGIVFLMYCGELRDNVANQNVPTGNVLQEGGSLSISGKYEIDNVTVINGTFLRPELGNKTVNIVYHYEIQGQDSEEKITIVTVGYAENGDLMKINLPSSLPIQNPMGDGTLVLVRWERQVNGQTQAYPTGLSYSINETTVGGAETIEFFAVWILQGVGFAENTIVSPDEVYSHIAYDQGFGATSVEIGGYFTVQFAVSVCDPDKFNERILSFDKPLKEGTTIIMIDITMGAKVFYYYTFTGEETEVNLSQFKKLGDPNTTWSSTIQDNTNKTTEEFLFIFDFTKAIELYSGALQITLTRTYKDTTLASIVQVGSCAVVDHVMPELEVGENDYFVGDEFTLSYTPGFIANNADSIYYSDYVTLVFTAKEGTIPSESYLYDAVGDIKYLVNRSGSIIVPLGLAKEAKEITLQLVSPYLIGAGEGIELDVSVRATLDVNSPLASQEIALTSVTLLAKPIPAADISIINLIYYVGELPDDVTVAVNTENVDGYILEWSVYRANGNAYDQTDYISVSEDGTLTFAEGITEGVYRIKLSVKDAFGNVVTYDVQNIAVLTRVAAQ